MTAAPVATVAAAESPVGDLAFGPGIDEIRRTSLSRLLTGLRRAASISVNDGWSLAWERARWELARRQRRRSALLSIRLFSDEVQMGPLWSPGTTSGCAGCAELRSRLVTAHPLTEHMDAPRSGPRFGSPGQPEWLAVAADAVDAQPLAPGELVIIGARGSGRHRLPRAGNCPICGAPPPDPRFTPPAIAFEHVPALPDDPLRAPPSVLPLDRTTMRTRLVDARFGPLVQVMRDTSAPFAMSDAVLPGAPAMGYGRALTFGASEPVAILEAYERLGGAPGPGVILKDVPYREIIDRALDPATLGGYTAQQFASPLCRVVPSDATTPMDWAWGHVLGSAEPVLVPAEIAFYGHRHDRPAGAARRRRYFEECSSGCALGGSLTEATLHALLELHERDSFLLAWHRAAPLPSIDHASLRDSLSRELLALIASRGFKTHLLVTTADIDLPAVWTLAIRRDGTYPASYSTAGAGADPARAIRSALWELAQQVCEPPKSTRDHVEPMAVDPWLVATIDDHIGLYTLPAMLPRLSAVLGGPVIPLDEAFPGWPDCLADAAGGDVHGALDQVVERFRQAGLEKIIVVDQSSRDHLDLGLRVVKAVVPGIVPMCFGYAQQRLLGIERLARVIPAGRESDIPYDPHPFP